MTPSRPPSALSPDAARQALEQALLASHRGCYEEAERLAAPVVANDPGNALAAQLLASALLGQGRPAEAIAPLREAARRSEDPATETFLGHALAGTGQAQEALQQLRNAASRRPPFMPAFLELGCQLAAAGLPLDAIAILEEGLTLAPGSAALKLALANLLLQRNDRTGARRLFEEAHAAEPNRVDGLVGMAKVSVLDADYAAAAADYRRALALQPQHAFLRIELAKCLLETGAEEEGLALLRSASGGSPALAAQGAVALAASGHGKFFLRTDRALQFMRGEPA